MIMTTTATLASERKSALPMRVRSTTIVGSSHIPLVSRPHTPVSTVMHMANTDETSHSFNVGDRVLVNGLKSGTVRYTGRVQFATGVFCGVELDEPDGKHDGQVNNIRYFQCPPNYGVFVPYDKIILEPRERASSMNRSMSRLKPPTVKRSMTMSAPHPRTLPTSVSTRRPAPEPPATSTTALSLSSSVKSLITQTQPSRLPDIVPIPAVLLPPSSPVVLPPKPLQRRPPPEIPSAKTTLFVTPVPEVPTIDETLEIMGDDFTESVSLILHQLQQEPKPNKLDSRASEAISEEGTIDDDDNEEDDFDVLDAERIIEQPIDPSKRAPIQRLSSTSSSKENNKSLFNLSSQMQKAMSSMKQNFFGIKPNKGKLVRQTNIKGDVDRTKPISSGTTTPRRISLIPSKNISPLVNPINTPSSNASLASNSKHSSSHSSQSDLPSKVQMSTKRTNEPIENIRTEKKLDTSKATIEALEHQLMMNRVIVQSLEMSNDEMKKQKQYLLNRFDLMCCLTQYLIHENDQYRLQLNKYDHLYRRMQNKLDQQFHQHEQALILIDQTHRSELESLKMHHQEQIHDYQQRLDQLTSQRNEFEQRCQVLDERVKNFMTTLAEDENADVVTATLEKLEKDRASLQTVIEMRNEELNQLRTKINEQVLQYEDQLALQKRIDMAENRNQDLVCLIRQWQLNEKAVTVERDELKEKVAQLERDQQQLTFENEILRYHAHQYPLDSQSTSMPPTTMDDSKKT